MNPPAAQFNRPATVMGDALAARSVAIAAAMRQDRPATSGDLIDLTRPITTLAPEHVRQAARDALARGETHYTVRPGVPALRAAFAARSTEDGFPTTIDGTIVTNGGSEALFIALQATLKPGDRALVAGPVAPNVIAMIRFIGAEVTRLPADVGSQSSMDSVAIGEGRAALLLLASPSPLSGVDLPPAHLEATIAAAVDRGTTVILDRSASGCRYDGTRPTFDPELGARIVTTGSLSISHGLDGWRVGYLSSPAERMAALRDLKQAMSICTTAVSQFAALAALEGPTDWLANRRGMFARRRDAAMNALRAAGLDVMHPDAYPSLLIDTRLIDTDDRTVARLLRDERGVAVEPASMYGDATRGYVRIDLGAAEQSLIDGIKRITDPGTRTSS